MLSMLGVRRDPDLGYSQIPTSNLETSLPRCRERGCSASLDVAYVRRVGAWF